MAAVAGEHRGKLKFIEQQAEELRRHILEATRRFLVEKGYAALTMRALAVECRVSVPTLYRKFGGKQELVLEAVRDQFRTAILGQVLDAAGLEGHVRLLRLLDLCADEIARMPDYYRALLSVFVGESSSEPGSEAGPGAATAINVEIIAEVHRALRQMREQGQLADWVDLEVLADRVAAEGMICAMQWGSGELSVEGYRDAYAYATCMLLLGVTGGDAHAALLDRARQTQSGARSIQAKPAPVSGGLPGLSSGQR